MESDELREKIATELASGTKFTPDGERCPENVNPFLWKADRILAILPEMPKLEWREYEDDEGLIYPVLFLGNLPVGHIHEYSDGLAIAWLYHNDTEPVANGVTPTEARAAVEAAVKEALGWKD